MVERIYKTDCISVSNHNKAYVLPVCKRSFKLLKIRKATTCEQYSHFVKSDCVLGLESNSLYLM